MERIAEFGRRVNAAAAGGAAASNGGLLLSTASSSSTSGGLFCDWVNVDEKEKVQVILVTISVSHFVQNQELKLKLERLMNEDLNLKIREAARIALEKFII